LSFPAGTSPLNGFLQENNINLAQLNIDAGNANTVNEDFGTADRKSELEKQLRDTIMKAPVTNTKTICQFLIKFFTTNPKKLGLYGITVDDSPRGVVRRNSKLAPGAQKYISGVHIGGFFTNTGITTLKLFAGKKVSGDGITVGIGKEWIVLKGYSNMTVVNTDTEKAGSYSVDLNR
ncbi:MAG: hypothetical protein AABZ32_03225, partial [Bacteroidota bacterium]